ncbi:hypothetical protein FGG08_003980 [Glutinoglossum americanum]|uniref:Prion-inhibition and propagation HeLo domain-containing protein n=1 Tax=Glutinoglossum americanum TaxID=1670608 RepID=A0A9P8L2Z2_9PEZI|nr:hypothetical protein FGG08_003980 [Glutinoglossum americanum]
MTDPVGVTFAVAGLASIFTACVDCFGYVQLGRKFGKDYQRCLLKLDIARLRLSRWGESVKIYENTDGSWQRHEIPLKSKRDAEAVRGILGEIMALFADAEVVSNRYKSKAKSTDLALHDSTIDLEPDLLSLHNKMRDLAINRQKRTGFAKKAAWALYDQKQFSRLIEDVSQLVSNLVELFPATERQQQLCLSETKEMGGEADLQVLKDAANGVDDLLQETVIMAISSQGGHQYNSIQAFERARIGNGNYVAAGYVPNGPGHIYNGITASGDSRVWNGDNYGGKSIFDD